MAAVGWALAVLPAAAVEVACGQQPVLVVQWCPFGTAAAGLRSSGVGSAGKRLFLVFKS